MILCSDETKNANCTYHILRRNFFLKHLIEGRLKGKREDMERRERRHRKLFDDLKENKGY